MAVFQRFQSKYAERFRIQQVGTSVEGRALNLITVGKGPIKIFLWSQMHGDESTATRAMLDMLNFIFQNAQENFVDSILQNTTLLLLPMVNPDGAERSERRNALGIDINRDAKALQTPEAKTLKSVRDQYTPEFGFNLHDQDPRFAVGNTDKIAAIALLAPAYDEAKSTNSVRLRAKYLAACFAQVMAQFVPGHISRYDESYEARAFGDNMQTWGTSTILIESGGWYEDPKKEFIRKLNYIGLLTSLYTIATGSFQQTALSLYESLPENNKNVYDIVVRNVALRYKNHQPSVLSDVGINVELGKPSARKAHQRRGVIVDLGDLRAFQAFRTLDAKGKTLLLKKFSIGTAINMSKLLAEKLLK